MTALLLLVGMTIPWTQAAQPLRPAKPIHPVHLRWTGAYTAARAAVFVRQLEVARAQHADLVVIEISGDALEADVQPYRIALQQIGWARTAAVVIGPLHGGAASIASSCKDLFITPEATTQRPADFDKAIAVPDLAGALAWYGVHGPIATVSETWVDSLVGFLNHPVATVALVAIGLVFVFIELSAAGIGLAALPASLCFLLFFWSKMLGGSATWLEVLLFLAGLACIGIEVFVIPGFGVVGLAGIVLLCLSMIMASQGYTWPNSTLDWSAMSVGLFQLLASVLVAGVACHSLTKYFKVLPTNSALHLPQIITSDEEFDPGTDLANAVGITLTDLRPAGKVRVGEMSLDVISDGFYISAGETIRILASTKGRIVVGKVS